MSLKKKFIDLCEKSRLDEKYSEKMVTRKDEEYEQAFKMLERLALAKERIKKCIHRERVIQVFDDIYDEVMCLECGSIKHVNKGMGTQYTSRKELPGVMLRSR